MSESNLLDGLKILVVDDEQDILDIVAELLPRSHVIKASNFHEASQALRAEKIDIAVLDIMGVDGYGLLEIAKERGIPAVMLTAHAFSPDNLARSIREGADSYIPKEELGRLEEFLIDVLKARKCGESTWKYWEEKLPSSYFEKRWGAMWQNADKSFWESFRAGIQKRRQEEKK